MNSNPELPEIIRDDPRVGRMVRTPDGFVGAIDFILRWTDGMEMFELHNEQTGSGCGGFTIDQITFLDDGGA